MLSVYDQTKLAVVRKLAVMNFNIKRTFRPTLIHSTFGDHGNLKILNLIEKRGFLNSKQKP